jgi:hypothetical protein
MELMTTKRGRPTKYSEKIAKIICDGLASGRSLVSICQDTDLPNRATVFDWLRIYPVFHDRYRLSREFQVMGWADEIVDLADDQTVDVQRSKVMIDSRKWLLSRLLPAYRDKAPAHEPPKALTESPKDDGHDLAGALEAWRQGAESWRKEEK